MKNIIRLSATPVVYRMSTLSSHFSLSQLMLSLNLIAHRTVRVFWSLFDYQFILHDIPLPTKSYGED